MRGVLALLLLTGVSASALAERAISHGGDPGSIHSDVVVDMPREVWTRGTNSTPPPCLRCCVYDNRHYSEGAVLQREGVLLQCVRDEKTLGSNTLIWRIVK